MDSLNSNNKNSNSATHLMLTNKTQDSLWL
jgi:hypothetical protein